MTINQLDIDDLQEVGKLMFSIANGNHILRYSEVEYRNLLVQSPELIVELLTIYYASSNWGYDDARMFEDYDEQWLAEQVDPDFKSSLDFDLPDFDYANLRPYQQVVIDFTYALIQQVDDFSILMEGGTPIESIYAVLACNMDLDTSSQEVRNKEHAISRGLEMYRTIFVKGHVVSKPFEDWELVIY